MDKTKTQALKKNWESKGNLKKPQQIITTSPHGRSHYWCKPQQGPHLEPPCCLPGPAPGRPAMSHTKRKPHKAARGKKTGLGKYTPIVCGVWPWALLTIMANAGRNGNYHRQRVKGILSVSKGVMLRWGMKTRLPLSGHVAILASIMCYISLTTISRMSFARPPDIFRSKITGQPSCKVKVWGGTPDMLREFRNSVG